MTPMIGSTMVVQFATWPASVFCYRVWPAVVALCISLVSFPLIVDRRFGIRTLRRFRLHSLSYGGQVAARSNVRQVALFWPRLPTTFYDARASHFMANRFFAGDPR